MPDETNDTTPAPPMAAFQMVGDLAPLFTALAEAQAEFEALTRDREVEVRTKDGRSYRFAYATFAEVILATGKGLSKHGLNLMHIPFDSPNGAKLIRHILTHKSGAYIESVQELGSADMSWQEVGSAQTYSSRYFTNGILHLAADNDDDGNAASGNSVQGQRDKPRREPPAPKPAPVTPPVRTQLDPGTGEPMIPETATDIKTEIRRLSWMKPQVLAECKAVTGKAPEDLDQAGALKFLAYLREKA